MCAANKRPYREDELMIEYMRMSPKHIDGMVTIEEQCFNSGFGRKTFEKELQNKIAVYIVATEDEKVLGYAGLWNMCGVADIMDVAVHKDYRRRGIAQKILEKLFDICIRDGIDEINLEVRASNVAAQNLYRKLGFDEVGLRRAYYENREDALLMKKLFTGENKNEDTCN